MHPVFIAVVISLIKTVNYIFRDATRGSWISIKNIFQGQYGTHMDPQTAYLRCHELQYEELGSVQALTITRDDEGVPTITTY